MIRIIIIENYLMNTPLYKNQWNTKWAFPRTNDIFTCEKISIAMAT